MTLFSETPQSEHYDTTQMVADKLCIEYADACSLGDYRIYRPVGGMMHVSWHFYKEIGFVKAGQRFQRVNYSVYPVGSVKPADGDEWLAEIVKVSHCNYWVKPIMVIITGKEKWEHLQKYFTAKAVNWYESHVDFTAAEYGDVAEFTKEARVAYWRRIEAYQSPCADQEKIGKMSLQEFFEYKGTNEKWRKFLGE